MPYPFNGTSITGLSGSFDVIESIALFSPPLVGEKISPTVHSSDGSKSLMEQSSPWIVKSDALEPAILASLI